MTQPYYPAGPYAGQPYRKVRRLDVLTPLAVLAACLLAFFSVVEAAAFYVFIDDYRDAARAGQTAWEVTTWADLAALPLFASGVFAYVSSCLWLQRARANTLALGSDPSAHQRSAVWVWLGWWVPIVNLWFPYQVVRDVWNESQTPRRDSVGLGLWWAVWVTGLFASQAAGRMSTSGARPLTDGTVDAIGFFFLVSAAAGVIGLLLWIRIVLRITRAQQDRARNQGIVMA